MWCQRRKYKCPASRSPATPHHAATPAATPPATAPSCFLPPAAIRGYFCGTLSWPPCLQWSLATLTLGRWCLQWLVVMCRPPHCCLFNDCCFVTRQQSPKFSTPGHGHLGNCDFVPSAVALSLWLLHLQSHRRGIHCSQGRQGPLPLSSPVIC